MDLTIDLHSQGNVNTIEHKPLRRSELRSPRALTDVLGIPGSTIRRIYRFIMKIDAWI